jgi:TPR repeat protein
MNKACVVCSLGDNRGAVALYDRAIDIWGRLVNGEGRRELANDLAAAYMNKASEVSDLGDNHGAVLLYDQAIAIRERLVNQEGRHELVDELAMAYMNKAAAMSALGDNRGAVLLYDQVIAIWERLVNREGHRELANHLATAYMNKACVASALGDNRGAVLLYDQVIAIWGRLVNQEGCRELVGDLARITAYRGETLILLGERARGLEEMRSVQRTLEAEIARTGRADLRQVLTWLQQQLRGSAIATQSESLRTPQTQQATRLMDSGFVVLDFDRGDIEAGDTSDVMAVLKQLLERDAATKFCERVDLCCSGYDSDSRELWEIPEVRAFVQKLDQQFPYWCYFLSRNGEGLMWLTYCLYPLALSQDEKQRLWLPAIRKYIEDRGIPQMTAICRYVGCSDQGAVRLTNSAVNYLVNKPLGKYVTDQGEQQGVSSNSERFPGAAERGDADAQYYLGSLYYAGHGAAEDPEDYFIPQDYGLAAMWFQKAADKGHAHAQFALGVLYDEGQGVAQHYAQAAAWFRKAAEQGDADAQFNLGRKYYNGQGMLQDCTQAVVWLRKAAEQGHAEAQFSLGERCFCGEGVPQDNSQAAAWFLKAARQGNADAQGYLGYLYDHGLGVMQDSAQAAAWLLKAAEQGNAYAQNSLGILYRDGQGVPQDYVQAAAWFRKAAALGHSEAVSNLSMLCANGRLPRR